MGTTLMFAAAGGNTGIMIGLSFGSGMEFAIGTATGYHITDMVDHTIAGAAGGEIAGAFVGMRMEHRKARHPKYQYVATTIDEES